ncbi:MAG: hypothetical protein N3E38_02265 [Candidatus Aenigmarchaeota archaeon]|nr:hypothetical protein [Candidatus Aenigmarchaeota archaeon]
MSFLSFLLNILRVILSFFFLLSVSSFLAFWSFQDFTKEDVIKPAVAEVIYAKLNEELDEDEIAYINKTISENCLGKENFETTFGDIQFNISCKSFKNSRDIKSFLSQEIASYYYECKGDVCEKTQYEWLLTRRGHKVFSKLTILTFVSSLFFGLLLFVIETGGVSKKLKSISVILLLACLPALITYFLLEPIKQKYISHPSLPIDSMMKTLLEIATNKYILAFSFSIFLLTLSFVFWFFEKKKQSSQSRA